MLRLLITASLLALLLAATPGYWHRIGSAAADSAQCQSVITPAGQSFGARGGVGSTSILAANNCVWTATSNVPWINLVSAGSGTGLSRINYSVIANTGANQRTGVIAVAGKNFVVTQAGTSTTNCTVSPINTGQTINGSLTQGDCASPLRIKDGARPLADRYTFNASGGQALVISLNSADFDTYLYLLDASGSVIAQNDDSISGGSSRVPANKGFFILPASGAFTIEVTAFSSSGLGNYTLSLNMPAGNCTYAINPNGQAFTAGGGTSMVNINTQAGCTWDVMSNNSWLTISAAGSGSGPGTVNYTVASNSGVARTGLITAAGLSFIVTQAGTNGAGCPSVARVNQTGGAPGSTVTITGTNFTGVTAIKFASNVAARFTTIGDTQISATVPNGAVTGPLIISKPTCPDTQAASFTIHHAVASVSAASFLGASLASESIVAAFGQSLATRVEVANTVPLPTALAGTTVKVKDIAGVERAAPLFFIAPTQINFLIPAGTANGTAIVTVTSGDGAISMGNVNIKAIAPGLFTASASGQGLAAAVALRVKADGSVSYEPITRFDPAQNRIVAVPIDLGPETDQVFLLLFGTGWRFRSAQANVSLTIGGLKTVVDYAGPQGDFVGLDQINSRLSRNLIGSGEVDVILTVDGVVANTVKVAFK